jgi:hypothetical protein
VKTPLAHWWRKGMSAGEFRPVTVTVKVEKRSIRDRNVERNPGFASEESVLSTGFYRAVGSKYLIERGWPEGGGAAHGTHCPGSWSSRKSATAPPVARGYFDFTSKQWSNS